MRYPSVLELKINERENESESESEIYNFQTMSDDSIDDIVPPHFLEGN